MRRMHFKKWRHHLYPFFTIWSKVLAREIIKWQNSGFSRSWSSLITFWYERYENKNDTIVFALSSRFGKCTFLPWKVNFKTRPRVGKCQVKLIMPSKKTPFRHIHPSKSICISSEAARRTKSFDTICVSLSPSGRGLLAKNGLWLHLNSFGLRWPLRDPRSSVAPGHLWVVSVGSCETESIYIFPHRLIMRRSRNWADFKNKNYETYVW